MAIMSAAMNWPSRTPASNPSAAISTKCSFAAISTSISGYALQKDAINGSSRIGTTAGGTVRRSNPAGLCPRSRATALAATSSSKAGFARDKKRSPASVRPTLRVVRMNSAAPTRASSARTAAILLGHDLYLA